MLLHFLPRCLTVGEKTTSLGPYDAGRLEGNMALLELSGSRLDVCTRSRMTQKITMTRSRLRVGQIIACLILVSAQPAAGILNRHHGGFDKHDLLMTLDALDNGLQYMANKLEEINLDAVIGTREVQGGWQNLS